MSGIVAVGVYIPFVSSVSRALGILLYALFILVTIGSYVGIFIANIRHRTTMNQYVGQALAILQREKKLANTVGLILIVLCCTFIPALIAPLALLLAGFESVDGLIPFRPLYRVFMTLNGFLNPLLNYGRNGNIRRAVRGLIRFPHCRQRVHPSHTGASGLNQNEPMNIPQRQRTV